MTSQARRGLEAVVRAPSCRPSAACWTGSAWSRCATSMPLRAVAPVDAAVDDEVAARELQALQLGVRPVGDERRVLRDVAQVAGVVRLPAVDRIRRRARRPRGDEVPRSAEVEVHRLDAADEHDAVDRRLPVASRSRRPRSASSRDPTGPACGRSGAGRRGSCTRAHARFTLIEFCGALTPAVGGPCVVEKKPSGA